MMLKGQTYIILAVVFAVIIAIFAVINVEPVEVDYLFGTGNAPLILVILFSVLMGAIVTGAVGVFRFIRLQKEMRLVKEENNALKAQEQPIVDMPSDQKTDESDSLEIIENDESK
jgi:lipopolysaccharide assembly protein A